MAVDPTINLAAQDLEGTFWAYEVCDPVEDDQYGYDIGGVLVSDFVTPAWFGFQNSSGPLDFQHHATKAFQVLTGGYAQKFGKGGWQQVNGDLVAKSTKAHVKDLPLPEGSRRERRTKLHQLHDADSTDKKVFRLSASAHVRNTTLRKHR